MATWIRDTKGTIVNLDLCSSVKAPVVLTWVSDPEAEEGERTTSMGVCAYQHDANNERSYVLFSVSENQTPDMEGECRRFRDELAHRLGASKLELVPPPA